MFSNIDEKVDVNSVNRKTESHENLLSKRCHQMMAREKNNQFRSIWVFELAVKTQCSKKQKAPMRHHKHQMIRRRAARCALDQFAFFYCSQSAFSCSHFKVCNRIFIYKMLNDANG